VNVTIFEGLPKCLKRGTPKFSEFIEKENSVVR
jgi:hypothetical protein